MDLDGERLNPAIRNLAINARDTTPTGGIFRVRVDRFEYIPPRFRARTRSRPTSDPGDWTRERLSPHARARVPEPIVCPQGTVKASKPPRIPFLAECSDETWSQGSEQSRSTLATHRMLVQNVIARDPILGLASGAYDYRWLVCFSFPRNAFCIPVRRSFGLLE